MQFVLDAADTSAEVCYAGKLQFPAAIKINCGSFVNEHRTNGCRISLVSTGPQLIRPPEAPDRNWLPIIVAAAAVIAAVVVLLLIGHGRRGSNVVPPSTAVDPYAPNLRISGLAMSEASNLAGGKVTYLDGHITNVGSRTVTGIDAQILFRNVAREVAQNETQPVKFIRMRNPYIDVESVSAAPLKPGDERDFRLIFDSVTPNWDGAYPEIRIIHVDLK